MPSNNKLTISEVSQKTGVATVTLRAWERRYGLLSPNRTPKGHRIYSEEDILKIQRILAWLHRGVTISKVSDLLEDDEPTHSIKPKNETYTNHKEQLFASIKQLKQRQVDQLLDTFNKSLPFITLTEHLYLPLNNLLIQRWLNKPLGYELEQQLWEQSWQRQTLITTLRAAKQKQQGACYLINVTNNKNNLELDCLKVLLLQDGVHLSIFNNTTDIASLMRLENSKAQSLIIYSTQRQYSNAINTLFKLGNNWGKQLICLGPMVDIHYKQLTNKPLNIIGGNVVDCWTSPDFKTWLTDVKSTPLSNKEEVK